MKNYTKITQREILEEGWAFSVYVLNKKPNFFLLKRYLQYINRKSANTALKLPRIFIKYPIFLSLINSSSFEKKEKWEEFEHRLNIITWLSEASHKNNKKFRGQPYQKRYVFMIFFPTIIISIFWMILSICLRKLMKIILSD
jgi:hypothetical protein